MMYDKKTLVGTIYEESPIAHDLLNKLTELGQKKYGFCKDEIIKNLTLGSLEQMVAHLIDEKVFEKLFELVNHNPMKLAVKETTGYDDIILYECSEKIDAENLEWAEQLDLNYVIVPWDLEEDRAVSQRLIQTAHEKNRKILFSLCLHRQKNGTEVDWSDAEVRKKRKNHLQRLIEQGCDGFCFEEADLLLSCGKEADLSTDFRRIRGVAGKETILFAPETEQYLREIMEEIAEPAQALIVGKTYFDGVAVAACQTGALNSVFHLGVSKLSFDEMNEDSADPVDLNDYKKWTQERIEDIPSYWPVISMETVKGIPLAKLAEKEHNLQRKSAELLLLLQCTLRGTPYLMQNDISGHIEFLQKLLKLRKEYPALAGGKIQMMNERLYDLFTFVREDKNGNQIYIECNLSANEQVIPYGRPENAERIISNYEGTTAVLRPYEATAYRVC